MIDMEIENLSIGSWVEQKGDGFPMFVQALYGKDTVYLDFDGNEGDTWEVDIKDIKPIPITKEILLSNDFKKDWDQESLYFGFEKEIEGKKIILLEHFEGNTWRVYIKNNKDTELFLDIKYVHQLQKVVNEYISSNLKIVL